MYIAGDIGNTDTKICLISKDFKILRRFNYSSGKIRNSNSVSFVKSLLKLKLEYALFSSVVPRVYKNIKKLFRKKGIKCYELKNLDLKNFINLKVNKKQVGSDRIANAISVIDKKKNYIIVDFGTATTFDVIIKNDYLGGVIAPGVDLSLRTLISKASLIPKVKLKKIKNVVGKNTNSAVRSGFFWGYRGLIEKMIKLITSELNKKFIIVLTGGLSYLFNKPYIKKNKIDKDLTIKGLIKIIKKRKIYER